MNKTLNVLAKGPPTVAETPVNIKQSPNALVRFSKPSSSTMRMERREAKQAAIYNPSKTDEMIWY